MDGGAKTKAGIAGVGVLAVFFGLADDCARVARPVAAAGDDFARVGAGYGDDLARLGAYGDDFGRIGAHGDDALRLGAAGVLADDAAALGATRELAALRSSSWDDLAIGSGASGPARGEGLAADVAQEVALFSLDAADLLLDEVDDPDVEGHDFASVTLRVRSILAQTVSRARVAAIAPLDRPGDGEMGRARRDLTERGVGLLDAPSALAQVLEREPIPLFVIARAAEREGGGALRAPDDTDLDLGGLLHTCRDAGADCVVLACESEEATCLLAAADLALGALEARPTRTQALLADVLARRNEDPGAHAIVIHRLAGWGEDAHLVHSRVDAR